MSLSELIALQEATEAPALFTVFGNQDDVGVLAKDFQGLTMGSGPGQAITSAIPSELAAALQQLANGATAAA